MISKIVKLAILYALLFVSMARAGMSGNALDELMVRIIAAESSGRADATGEGGERGLMQIGRATWERFSAYPWSDAYDAEKNVQVGRMIIEHIAMRYGDDATPARIVFTYNTGRYARGKLPAWTKAHPNLIYREVLNG